jgi:predicted methyltransferase
MAHRVCPWWIGYLLLSPLRKFKENPKRILSPYLKEGTKVLELGPGMGYFTIPIAKMIGPVAKSLL